MLDNIHWLGHATFCIENDQRIYIDPWKLDDGAAPADLILISHSHFDHFSVSDIEKIHTPRTLFVTAEECARLLMGRVEIISPGKKTVINNIAIEGVPAYNLEKEFHPKDKKWVGFLITIDGHKIYYAGDTDLIPEMESLGNIDIAMLPVSGTYLMSAQEAASIANKIKPRIAIPYHWGDIIGTREDAEEFVRLFDQGRGIIVDIGR